MLTILGLCAGMTAIRYALDGRFELAVTLIGAAVVLDGLDGRSARMLNLTSKLGAELDSLADFLSFGVAPAVLTYLWTLHDVRGVGWARGDAVRDLLRPAPRPLQHRARSAGPAALDAVLLHRHPGARRGRAGADAADRLVRGRRRLAAQLVPQRRSSGVRGGDDGQPGADLLDQADPDRARQVLPTLLLASVVIVGLVVETWLTLSLIGLHLPVQPPVSVVVARRMRGARPRRRRRVPPAEDPPIAW